MHDYFHRSFSCSEIPKRVANAEVYSGQRVPDQQDVLVYKVSFVNIGTLEKFFNEFMEHALSSHETKVTDCHLDLTNMQLIFAVTSANTDFIGEPSSFLVLNTLFLR